MKNNAFLSLIEQLCMVLLFSIAAAICLQGFAKTNEISRAQQEKDSAVVIVQNAAEIVKHTGGDLDRVAQVLDGHCDDTSVIVFYDDQWQPVPQEHSTFSLRIQHVSSVAFLGTAQIQALRGNTVIFELHVSWQEVQ
jgi:hypothetical protein